MFTQSFGYLAEDEIIKIWQQQHPFHREGIDVAFGRWSLLPDAFRAKPDILNYRDWTYNEIKPLSLSGIAAAIVQIDLRRQQFDPLGYRPDYSWPAYPTPLIIGAQPMVIVNVLGVIFYTDIVDLAEDYVVITSFRALRRFIIEKGVSRGLLGAAERIPALIRVRNTAEPARAESQWSIGALISTVLRVPI